MKWSVMDKVAYTLLVIGGLNWGLIGFFKYNLVDKIFGVGSGASRVVYAIVGLAALWGVWVIVSMMASQSRPAATGDTKAHLA